MKRYIAGSYSNTSIMHPEVVDGIQERVEEFLRQCEEAGKPAIDFYVRIVNYIFRDGKIDRSRIICTVLPWIVPRFICSIPMEPNLSRAEISI